MSELIPLFAVQGMRLVRELRRPEANMRMVMTIPGS
jgi:hypothetical protein